MMNSKHSQLNDLIDISDPTSVTPKSKLKHLKSVASLSFLLMIKLLIVTVICVIAIEACSRSTNNGGPPDVRANANCTRRVLGNFATYDEIMAWYTNLARRYPDFVRLINIGDSYEGRKQMVMRLSPRPTDDRPVIFMEAGMHAREWLAPASLNYLIYNMIVHRNNRRYRRAFSKYIFYFMSVTNPDGYVFSFDRSNRDNRFWRKNRRRITDRCIGVDLNRNWDINFGGSGTSTEPCSDIYQGTSAFSEPETRNMRNFMLRRIGRNRLTLYISLHSYSQIWIVPWSYTERRKPANYRELKRAAIYASKAAKRETGIVYRVGNGADVFGVTAAGSDDWVLRHMRANYSYTLECRPTSQSVKGDWKSGFAPPVSIIIPSGRELVASVFALVDTMNTR